MCAYQRSWDQTSREAWERQRLAQDFAKGNVRRTPEIDAFLSGASKADAKKLRPQQPADPFKQINRDLGKLNKEIDANMKASEASRKHGKPKSHRGNLVADTSGSECFSYLAFSKSAGGVVADFIGPGAGSYFYPMSRSDARAWFNDSSLGAYFNKFVKE